jgi:hypothetical protein
MATESDQSDRAMAAMECAIQTIEASRLQASHLRQIGYTDLAKYYVNNAKAAERWLLQAGKFYPDECSSDLERIVRSPGM